MKRILLTSAVLALALSGCAAAEAHEPSAEQTPASVGYPVGWPKSDVPMLDGTLLHFAHPGNWWAGWVESTDLVADLSTATALLTDAGYTITLQAEGYIEFSNADRSGRVVAAVDGEWGPCLLYTFSDGAIEPTNATEQDAAPPAEEH